MRASPLDDIWGTVAQRRERTEMPSQGLWVWFYTTFTSPACTNKCYFHNINNMQANTVTGQGLQLRQGVRTGQP